MQRRSDEHARYTKVLQTTQVRGVANAAAGDQFHGWVAANEMGAQLLRADAAADADTLQVEHEQAAHAAGDRLLSDRVWVRLRPCRESPERLAVFEIERKENVPGFQFLDDGCQ